MGKWIAYDLGTGELVGRGGLSHLGAAETVTRRIAAALPGSGWLRDRLEVGWTVRSALWGQGYATEIGRAGLPASTTTPRSRSTLAPGPR